MQSYSCTTLLILFTTSFISIQDRCVFNMLLQVQTCFMALVDLFYHWCVACRIILMCVFFLQTLKSCIPSQIYLFLFSLINQVTMFLLVLSSVLCVRTRVALSCIDSQSFTFIYRMNDEGLAVSILLWIGTGFAPEWTYIGSIFTIHYKVDSLFNQPFYPLIPIPKIHLSFSLHNTDWTPYEHQR